MYRYKTYLTRAFWNSLTAVLGAVIIVAIILFIWQAWRNVLMGRIIPDNQTMSENELSRLEELETLKGKEEVSDEEKSKLLDALGSEEVTVSEEEKLRLLESLK